MGRPQEFAGPLGDGLQQPFGVQGLEQPLRHLVQGLQQAGPLPEVGFCLLALPNLLLHRPVEGGVLENQGGEFPELLHQGEILRGEGRVCVPRHHHDPSHLSVHHERDPHRVAGER